jgi:hypothetical protein
VLGGFSSARQPNDILGYRLALSWSALEGHGFSSRQARDWFLMPRWLEFVVFLSYVELCKDQALDYGDISCFSWPRVEDSGIISVCVK